MDGKVAGRIGQGERQMKAAPCPVNPANQEARPATVTCPTCGRMSPPTAAIAGAAESERLIPIGAVCDMLGLKKSAIYDLVARGDLSPPVKLGDSRRAASRWLYSEIVDFIQRKVAQRQLRRRPKTWLGDAVTPVAAARNGAAS